MVTAVAGESVSVAVWSVWRGMLRDCFTSAASLSIHFTLSSFPYPRVHGRPLVAIEDGFLRGLTLIVLGFPYFTLHPFSYAGLCLRAVKFGGEAGASSSPEP